MKGTITLSETILAGTGIIISFILIILVVQMVFSQQSSRTYESTFESLAREISTNIDRAAAAAGSIEIQQDIPKGLKFDLTIDYKTIIIKYNGNNAVKNSFVGSIKSDTTAFHDPTTLCIVKSINDNRVTITDRKCQCNENDNLCDASCILKNVCDSKCISDASGVCNVFCAKDYPDICDLNCHKNYITGLCEVNCIEPNTTDGVCSPDCNNLKKDICDMDCYKTYYNGTIGVCDPDCPAEIEDAILKTEDGILYKKSDGYCYTGCYNYTIEGAIVEQQYEKSGESVKKQASSQKNCSPGDDTNWRCLVVSKSGNYDSTRWQDYENQVWSCGSVYTWCGGELCDQDVPAPKSSWPLRCHAATVNPQMFPQAPVCCCINNNCEKSTRGECLSKSGEPYPEDDPQCPSSQQSSVQKSSQLDVTSKTDDTDYETIFLKSDGICDEDCKNTDNICDPDCKGSMSSEACKNKCTTEGNKTIKYPCCEVLIECPGDKICRKNKELACCGNDICEGRTGTKNGWGPGNKTKWETNFTCSQDCNKTALEMKINNTNKPLSCQAGSFKKSVCYTNVLDQGIFVGFEPVWRDNIFEVCHEEIVKFLDRRNWDINEVIKTWTDNTPESWAWDAAR